MLLSKDYRPVKLDDNHPVMKDVLRRFDNEADDAQSQGLKVFKFRPGMSQRHGGHDHMPQDQVDAVCKLLRRRGWRVRDTKEWETLEVSRGFHPVVDSLYFLGRCFYAFKRAWNWDPMSLFRRES